MGGVVKKLGFSLTALISAKMFSHSKLIYFAINILISKPSTSFENSTSAHNSFMEIVCLNHRSPFS